MYSTVRTYVRTYVQYEVLLHILITVRTVIIDLWPCMRAGLGFFHWIAVVDR